MIPVALRAVLCVLFYETRLLVRSLKPYVLLYIYAAMFLLTFFLVVSRAPWLARTISWAVANPNGDAYEEAEGDEPSAVFNNLAGLYVESQERPRILHQVRDLFSIIFLSFFTFSSVTVHIYCLHP